MQGECNEAFQSHVAGRRGGVLYSQSCASRGLPRHSMERLEGLPDLRLQLGLAADPAGLQGSDQIAADLRRCAEREKCPGAARPLLGLALTRKSRRSVAS